MLKVVFDTVVFVPGLINPYGICGRVVFGHYERYRLFVSRPVVEEILDVLQRPELSRKFRCLPGRTIHTVLTILEGAEAVDVSVIPTVSRDPKDDKFLATAEAAQATYLVSEDDDLLSLKEYEGIRIVNAATFLGLLEQERPS